MDLDFKKIDKLIMEKHPCRNCKYCNRREDGVPYYDVILILKGVVGIFCKNMKYRKEVFGEDDEILDYKTFDTTLEDLKNGKYAKCKGFCERDK
jgi:hypothetical protein